MLVARLEREAPQFLARINKERTKELVSGQTRTFMFEMDAKIEGVQKYYSNIQMIGKHYLMNELDQPMLRRHYTICNVLDPHVHSHYLK